MTHDGALSGGVISDGVARFFAFARERHAIALRRASGAPRPWTEDCILDTYRFTNVFREMDRTTVWIREHVRDRLEGESPEMQILGVVLARTINRTETLEQIFCQGQIDSVDNIPIGWSYLRGECSIGTLESMMRAHCPKPWVTGAYIVKTPDGMDKLRGALWIVDRAAEQLRAATAGDVLESHLQTMQTLHQWLVTFPYLGGFTAYEIVSDLCHMDVGRGWPDIMSWAHAGPGAVRGLNRIHGRDHTRSMRQADALREMREILVLAMNDGEPDSNPNWGRYWPLGNAAGGWPNWEMREVEHTLCEWDKYERARLGQGRPRGVYR